MSNQEFIERLYSEIVSERELREDAEAKAALCVETHAKQLASLREENYALRKTHEMMLRDLKRSCLIVMWQEISLLQSRIGFMLGIRLILIGHGNC